MRFEAGALLASFLGLAPFCIRSRLGCFISAAALAAASLANLPAYAQADQCAVGDRNCGREAFATATAAFDRGDYREALRWFESARSAGPHPIISFNVALCLTQLGKPSQAKRELKALLESPDAPAELKQRANDELARVLATLAHISLETPAKSSYVIELDGQTTSAESELEVDPGEHRLRVSSPSSLVFDQSIKLAPGEQLRLRVTGQARAIDVVVVPEREKVPPPPQRTAPFPPAALYVAASASVLFAGLSVWSGLDVKSAYADYRRDLPHLTQREADERLDDGHARERRTNVLLGATAVSVAATAALGLLWIDFGSRKHAVALGVSGQELRLGARF